jgi:hypothetical protein
MPRRVDNPQHLVEAVIIVAVIDRPLPNPVVCTAFKFFSQLIE